jgi:hypothetical protein
METMAHGRVFSYSVDSGVRGGIHRIRGGIEFYQGSHPAVFIEAGGHAVYATSDPNSRYSLDRDDFPGSAGVTYIYSGDADRPKHANDRRVSYDLLPAYEHWWMRAIDGRGRVEGTFDDDCSYRPLGGRPAARYPLMPGSFRGRSQARNRAKPFWAWADSSAGEALAPGQWVLDPAYAVSRTLKLPAGESFSLDYVVNPYLNPR